MTVTIYCFDFFKDVYVTIYYDHQTWTSTYFLYFSIFGPISLVYILYGDFSIKKSLSILFSIDALYEKTSTKVNDNKINEYKNEDDSLSSDSVSLSSDSEE